MGTWNAFYIRKGSDSMVAAVQKKFPEAKIEFGENFIGVTLADDAFEPPKDDLVKFSSAFETDVIWLSFQSVVDAFQFHHWRADTLFRSLVFGCYGDEERTWNQVEGRPEPWEREAFFDPGQLEFMLRHASSDQERLEFQRIWREEELVSDRSEPSIDARESARKAAEHYSFPGWS